MRGHTMLIPFLVISLGLLPFEDGNSETYMAAAIKKGLVRVDGLMDDGAWSKARWSTVFVELKTRRHKKAPAKTRFRILCEPQAIIIGVRCEEPMMSKLSDAPLPHDGPVWERDCIEIFIDPTGRGFEYYQFMISAGNTRYDAYYIEGGNTQRPYNSVYESAIHKGKDFWSAEVRIPLSALYYTAADEFVDAWLLNITRERKPRNELTTWAPLRRGFHEPRSFYRVTGLPKKTPRYDLRLSDVEIATQKSSKGYIGHAEFKVSAGKAAAGPYTLLVSDAQGVRLASRDVLVRPGDQSLELPGLSLAKLGKTLLCAKLRTGTGEVIAAAWFYPFVRYVPLKVILSEPFYANCIFPDEKGRRISGVVESTLPEEQLKNTRFQVDLVSDGRAIRSTTLRPVKRRADFAFKVRKLAAGEYVVRVRLVEGEKVVEETSLLVRKLSQPSRGNSVRIDSDLNLVVNGRRMFVRGWYGDEKYLVSRQLLDTLRHPNSRWVNAFGCSVGLEAERIDQTERSRVKLDVKPSEKVFRVMRERIEKHRGDPKLLWWYLADEPECRGLSPVYLKYQYEYIKRLDPYHPVMIISRAPERYVECADILNPHPYLNPTVDSRVNRSMVSPKAIRRQMQAVLSAGHGRIPPWCTPQAFSYGFIDFNARFPTYAEFRCMVYTAVVNRAKGLTPFAYFAHFGSIDMRIGVDDVYSDLARLEQFLLCPRTYPVKVQAPEHGVDARIWEYKRNILLITVNMTDRPVKARLGSPRLKREKTFYGFREPGTVKPSGSGVISLDYQPYQVRVFTARRIDLGLKRVADVMAEISRANSALRKPGNILFGRGREIEWDASDTYIKSKSLYTLTDGITDQFGWKDVFARAPARLEMLFPSFVPKFQTAKIYTATIQDLEFWAWKNRKWVKAGAVTGNKSKVITLGFKAPISTVKIRILMPKVLPGTRADVYEIELYE